MSIGLISNGENGLSVRQKLNSGISQLNSLNYATNTASKFSYIDPLNGSDENGNGSLSNPFQTIGAAYSAGAINFFISQGNAGVLNIQTGESNANYQIFGLGAMTFFPSSSSSDYPFSQTYDETFINSVSEATIVNNNATTSHIHIISNNGVVINLSGVASSSLGASVECACYNSILGNIILNGKNGENGANDNTSAPGENGGDGGFLYLGYCTVVGNISLIGGNGGDGGETFDGFGGGVGGNGGNGGNGGGIVSHYSRILGNVASSGGLPGLGGNGDGSNGSDGAHGNDGFVKSAYSMFSKIPVGSGSPPDFRFSMVNGNIV